MATSTISTTCSICKEKTTTYLCPGCSKYFCYDDLTEHCESLKPQFHQIEHQQNEFMQILSDQSKNHENYRPLIEQINQWEQTSINKIRQAANEQRQLVQQSIHQHIQNIQTKFNTFTEDMQTIGKRKKFDEMILNKLETQLEELRKQFNEPNHIEIKEDSSSTYINKLSIIIHPSSLSASDQTNIHRFPLEPNTNWKQYANDQGDKLNQLSSPYGIYVDRHQQYIYVADLHNHRIVKWKLGENNGQITAYGNGQGDRIDQLNSPIDVIVDENSKSLIICDFGNRRVVRWSLDNEQDKQIIIQDISCYGLMMNENGDLFVSDCYKDEVRRWRKGEKEGTIVAGGNGRGNKLNQLNNPTFIFIDRQETVYVSDWNNHRVMKWMKDAKKGTVVAGGQGRGKSLKQLDGPYGLIVNEVGDVYVADFGNDRIMCWCLGCEEGRAVVGGENGAGEGSNQLKYPIGLSFDADNNLYIADLGNHRIQRFGVNKN